MRVDIQIHHFLKIIFYFMLTMILLMGFYPFLVSTIGAATGVYAPFKVLKEILLIAALFVLLLYLYFEPKLRKYIFSNYFNWLILVYIVLNLLFSLATVVNGQLEAAIAGFFVNTRFFIAFLIMQIIVIDIGRVGIEKSLYKTLKLFLAFSILISIFAILQVTVLSPHLLEIVGYNGLTTPPPYATVDNNMSVLRAFSTLWGPNMLGSFLILPLSAFLVYFLKNTYRIYAAIGFTVSFIAIIATHSRSAMLAALATTGFVILFLKREAVRKYIKLLPLVILCLVTIGFLVSSQPLFRLFVFHSSEGDSSLLEGSTSGHFAAVKDNAIDALVYPIGQGVGTAGPASFYLVDAEPKIAENYFIQIAQEIGIVGLLLFLAISTFVLRKLYALARVKDDSVGLTLLASFIGINIINLFLHGWTDDPTALVWWSFAGGFIALSQLSSKKSTL